MVRRTRAERHRRATLESTGRRIAGVVRSAHHVSAGRHAGDQIRAVVVFADDGGLEHELVVLWTPHEARGHTVGTTVDLLFDPADPTNAVLAADAPHLVSDRNYRLLTAVVFVVCLIAALWA